MLLTTTFWVPSIGSGPRTVLILSPSVTAAHTLFPDCQHYDLIVPQLVTYLVKTRHRLISTSDLDLEERSLIGVATFPWTLHFSLLGICPRLWSTEYILTLGALEDLALKEPLC